MARIRRVTVSSVETIAPSRAVTSMYRRTETLNCSNAATRSGQTVRTPSPMSRAYPRRWP